jgi:Fe-S oxidoreductase
MNNKLNVLFALPPVDYPNTIINIGAELGVTSLISQVRKECDVNIFFYSFEFAKLVPPLYDIDEALDCYCPDIICISVLTHSYPFAKKLSMKAKERGCIVIWGGIYVSQKSSQIAMDNNYVDYYLFGEGEYSLPTLINEIQSQHECQSMNAKNIIYYPSKTNSAFECELPDFSVIPPVLIDKYGLRATMETTRGCKFKCEFCSLNKLDFKNKDKSVELLSRELINIIKYGFKKTLICDNNFILDNEKFLKFKMIKKEIAPELKLRITIRLDLLTLDILREFKKLNIDEIIVGIEHVDDNILASMKKTNTHGNRWVDLARKNILLAADMGFLVHPIFMFGWPGETRYTLDNNKDFACFLGKHPNIEPFIAFLTPHPGNNVEHFIIEGKIKKITSDYSKYIHLYPVAIPYNFDINDLKYMINIHNEIRTVSNMIYRNPCISEDFVLSYSDLLVVN